MNNPISSQSLWDKLPLLKPNQYVPDVKNMPTMMQKFL